MAVNLSTFASTLQTKFNNVTDPKEMLLLGKALEATIGNQTVSDIQAEGATQIAAVQAAGSGYATQADIDTSVAALVAAAPATLDTLNELAAALGDDPNFATTVTNSLATKASTGKAIAMSIVFGG